MGVDVVDLFRRNTGVRARGGHCGESGVALRMRLGKVMHIRRRAVADNFAQDLGAASPRVRECFQREDRRAFTQPQSVALRIEGPAPRRRKRLERIEASEDQLAERIVAARQRALGVVRRNNSQAWPMAFAPDAQALAMVVTGP